MRGVIYTRKMKGRKLQFACAGMTLEQALEMALPSRTMVFVFMPADGSESVEFCKV